MGRTFVLYVIGSFDRLKLLFCDKAWGLFPSHKAPLKMKKEYCRTSSIFFWSKQLCKYSAKRGKLPSKMGEVYAVHFVVLLQYRKNLKNLEPFL